MVTGAVLVDSPLQFVCLPLMSCVHLIVPSVAPEGHNVTRAGEGRGARGADDDITLSSYHVLASLFTKRYLEERGGTFPSSLCLLLSFMLSRGGIIILMVQPGLSEQLV